MSQKYDVIILGGGIIGSSVAAHLANEKLNIAVVNSTNMGLPASIASAGLLAPFQFSELHNPVLRNFCLNSFEYFKSFHEIIKSDSSISNINFDFRQLGSLYLIFSNSEIAQKESELKDLRKDNTTISLLTKQEALKYEPSITKEILGAYHFPQEGLINNVKFLKAIHTYCINKKITFINSEASEINYTKNKIENVVLSNGETISADKYALCNGIWANKFLKKLFKTEHDFIKPIKGEILQVGITPAKGEAHQGRRELFLQKIVICSDGYMLPRKATNKFEKDTILVGSTSEEVILDENNNVFHNTVSGISRLTSLFKKLTNLDDCNILNMWAGLRPKTRDSFPILGKTEIENLYCGLGHYKYGILTGPLSGKIISESILETCGFNIEPFKINRLLKKQTEKSAICN